MLRTIPVASIRTRTALLAAIAALCLAAPADAATVVGGTMGSDAVGAEVNDVFGSVPGYFGGRLVSSGAQTVQYTLLGYEAGYHNTFSAGNFGAIPGVVFSGGGGLSTIPLVSALIFSANGLVNFSFGANVPGIHSVANGSNPSVPTNAPNFFISFYNPNGTLGAASGNSGIIALDDGGGGNPADADYDDLVIKFQFTSAVPEASTWAMMVLGFAGIGYFARRRKPETALQLIRQAAPATRRR